jgi:hypothetical protein
MAEENCATVYFHFDCKDRLTQSAINVCRCLLKQLLHSLGSKPWPGELLERFKTERSESCITTGTRDILRYLFLCANQFSKVFFIFDALDECEDQASRWKVLDFLKAARELGPKVKILVTSRPQLPAHEPLRSAEVISIAAHDSDLELFIRTGIEHKCYRPSMRQEIVSKLLSEADGM